MNSSKYIRFLRRGKQLNWHRGQFIRHDPEQHGKEKIIEYQDRWTLSPSRALIWLNGRGSDT